MNQIAQVRRRTSGASEKEAAVHAQARVMDTIFKAIGRRILVADDAALDIPLRQFRVCAALFESPRSMKELSVELGVSQSAITQLADRLEASGLVTRGAVGGLPAGGDRRVKNLELTPRARKLLRDREEQRIDRVQEILQQLTAADRGALLESLGRFGAAAQELDGAND